MEIDARMGAEEPIQSQFGRDSARAVAFLVERFGRAKPFYKLFGKIAFFISHKWIK